jgi:hypothetical protein
MSSAPPPAAAPAFSDARGCKEWLGMLPGTGGLKAQSQLLEALRALNGAEMDGLERLKCMELLRDKVAFLQGEQRTRYFGKTLPLAPGDDAAWSVGRQLLEEMEAGYRRSLEAAAAGGEAGRHTALISQRVVRYLGAQMMFHAAIYRRFDPQRWTRLHRLYADAEAAGIAEEFVKDSLQAEEAGSSVAEAYAQVVLAQAAYLSELTATQMEFAEALLHIWARKVRVRRETTEGSLPPIVHPLVVDFDKPIGARPLRPPEVGANHRIVDVEQLSLSMRRRIHGLKNGEDPASLKLPTAAGSVEALAQLQRLHRLWCEGAPVRPPARVPDEKVASVAFGAGAAHYFASGGKVFEQPGQSRELTRQEKQDIEVFGQVSSRTQSMMVAEHSFTAEPWGVIDEMLGAWRLLRPGDAAKGVAIGRLLAMRPSDSSPYFLGMVSALVQETDGRIVITVALFPGRPEPVAVRGADFSRSRTSTKWVEGFRLAALERLRVPASVVVPTGIAAPGRGIELWEDGAAKQATVAEILERGSDFDRVRLG